MNRFGRLVVAVAILTGALAACYKYATVYQSGKGGSFNIYSVGSGHFGVALGNISDDSVGVKIIVFSTDRLSGGYHAIHIHNSCRGERAPISDGRLGNIEVEATGVGKFETVVRRAAMGDFLGKMLVIHEKKDYGYSAAEMEVGGVIGCGRIEFNSDQDRRVTASR